MAVKEKQRVNISLTEDDDSFNIARLRNFYEKQTGKLLTVAETVRMAIEEVILKNNI